MIGLPLPLSRVFAQLVSQVNGEFHNDGRMVRGALALAFLPVNGSTSDPRSQRGGC